MLCFYMVGFRNGIKAHSPRADWTPSTGNTQIWMEKVWRSDQGALFPLAYGTPVFLHLSANKAGTRFSHILAAAVWFIHNRMRADKAPWQHLWSVSWMLYIDLELFVGHKRSYKTRGESLSPVGSRWVLSSGHTASQSLSWPFTFSSTFHRFRLQPSKSLSAGWIGFLSSPLLGLAQPKKQEAFMGDHRSLYTKWQFSSSIIPCYCITRSYREASISFLRF